MHRRGFLKAGCAAGLMAWIAPVSFYSQDAVAEAENLETLFLHPPAAAFPQVYWFWMNGHVSRQGITQDLEAMKKAGVGGVFQFDAATGIPEGPVAYGSADWLELKKHVLQEALRLGLEVTLHNCPGWSSSGGPWITPELAMQQVTWNEILVKGGGSQSIHFPRPFSKLDYYRDIALLAFPATPAEASLADFSARSSTGNVDRKKVTGEDGEGVLILPENGVQAWLELVFPKEVEARNITFQVAALSPVEKKRENIFSGIRNYLWLEASKDGKQYEQIAQISTGLEAELQMGAKFITYDFPSTKARYFRLSLQQPRRLSQVRLSALVRFDNFMEKAGFRFMYSGESMSPAYGTPGQQMPAEMIIDKTDIYDLTPFLSQSGELQWNAPPGNWTLLRMGYTPTGALNKAAPAAGTGLECDKFHKAALTVHLEHAFEHLLPQLQLLAKKGKAGLEIDSFEAGMQNWTALMPEAFAASRGYSLIAFLPALTGRVVSNVDATERFLWDFRKVMSELVAENYYGHFANWCRQRGIMAYIQPYDKGPFNEMQIGAKADVPMGEHWNGLFSILQGNLPIRRTPKLAASIAHTTGKQLVGAEAFTAEPGSAKWQEYPFALKPVGDAAFIEGANKLVLHRFVHQPHPTAVPGMTMGPWGSHIDRTNTWWPQASAWLIYLARCQMLLQQGLFIADLAYLAPEESAVFTPVEANHLHLPPPAGYHYDIIHPEILSKEASVKNGFLVLTSGMKYRLLVLQDVKAMSLALLAKLSELVKQGLILIGRKPEKSLGIIKAEEEVAFTHILNTLWGNDPVPVNRLVGKGMMISGIPLQEILNDLSCPPDFTYTSRSGDAPVAFIHRKTAERDIFLLTNARRSYEEVVGTFRVRGKQPELWDPVTGKITRLILFEHLPGGVRLPLQLDPYGSLFIVFTKKAVGKSILSVTKEGKELIGTKPFVRQQQQSYPHIVNNFTITFWAKPETDILLQPSIHMEKVKAPYTDNYALYPPSGKVLYGEGHASCGLAVGRNGVAVWQREGATPELVMAAAYPLSGWSHIAVVYRDGVPEVYVNGALVNKGTKSSKIIHPGIGKAFQEEGASYYNGDMTAPELFAPALDAGKVWAMAQRSVPALQVPPIELRLNSGIKNRLLFFKQGKYTLERENGTRSIIDIAPLPVPINLCGSWKLEFPANHGAPATVELAKLESWHLNEQQGIRFFSGTATYYKAFKLPFHFNKSGLRWFLDLGQVEVLAEVCLNGKELGVCWTRPFQYDITEAIQEGNNRLEVGVTNLWPNRLIGDEQLPGANSFAPAALSGSFESLINGGIEAFPSWYLERKPKPDDGRISFTTWRHYGSKDPLLAGGLIGPVKIFAAAEASIET